MQFRGSEDLVVRVLAIYSNDPNSNLLKSTMFMQDLCLKRTKTIKRGLGWPIALVLYNLKKCWLTLLHSDGKMFPMTEKTLNVKKQVIAVKYLSEMKKSSSVILMSEIGAAKWN